MMIFRTNLLRLAATITIAYCAAPSISHGQTKPLNPETNIGVPANMLDEDKMQELVVQRSEERDPAFGFLRSPTHFLERNRFYNALPDKSWLFAADLAPHFYFFNCLDLVYDDLFWDLQGLAPKYDHVTCANKRFRKKNYQRLRTYKNEQSTARADNKTLVYSQYVESLAHTLSVTPRFMVRMYRDLSNPVRTPSYNPKLDYQFFYVRVYDDGRGVPLNAQLAGFQLTFSHHSNGQDGCVFTDQIRNEDGECVHDDTFEGDREYNRSNGDFSTNYFRFSANYKMMFLNKNGYVRASHAGSLSVEYNPKDTGLETFLTDELSDLYRPVRITAMYEAEKTWCWKLPYMIRGTAEFTGAFPGSGTNMDAPWYRVLVETAITFPTMGGFGLFLRGNFGFDDYNIQFATLRHEAEIGIIFDVSLGDNFQNR